MSAYQVSNYDLHKKFDAVVEKMQKTILKSSSKRNSHLYYYQILERANLPSNFILPEMEKFDGSGNPIVHLKLFIRTMALHLIKEEAMIVLFPMYLTKSALDWFYYPDVEPFTDFESIVESFVDQFYFNIVDDKASLRLLECTEQKNGEKFIDFVDRWRKQVSQVINRPDESKLMEMFIGNLLDKYSSKIFLRKKHKSFSDLISMGIGLDLEE